MDVLIDVQELPEPVRLRAICVVPDARRVGEAGTHPTSMDHDVRWPTQTASSGESEGKNRVNLVYFNL